MLESKTGDSRNEIGLRPGGMVMQEDLDIGSFAGDKSLYFALPLPHPLPRKENSVWPGSTFSELRELISNSPSFLSSIEDLFHSKQVAELFWVVRKESIGEAVFFYFFVKKG